LNKAVFFTNKQI